MLLWLWVLASIIVAEAAAAELDGVDFVSLPVVRTLITGSLIAGSSNMKCFSNLGRQPLHSDARSSTLQGLGMESECVREIYHR